MFMAVARQRLSLIRRMRRGQVQSYRQIAVADHSVVAPCPVQMMELIPTAPGVRTSGSAKSTSYGSIGQFWGPRPGMDSGQLDWMANGQRMAPAGKWRKAWRLGWIQSDLAGRSRRRLNGVRLPSRTQLWASPFDHGQRLAACIARPADRLHHPASAIVVGMSPLHRKMDRRYEITTVPKGPFLQRLAECPFFDCFACSSPNSDRR